MLLYIFIFILVILILILLLTKQSKKLNVFTYWTGKKPEYINLCIETMKKHLKNCELYILDEQSLFKFLPALPEKIKRLPIAQQSDIIRVHLLHRYGGAWIDADTILLKNPRPLFDIVSHDFIGFGNSFVKSDNGYPKPSNGVMASRKNGILISKIKQKLDQKLASNSDLNHVNYFEFGKLVIWEAIDELHGYSYKHHNSSVDGTRNSNKDWINTNEHLSKTFEIKDLLAEPYFIMLENHVLSKTPVANWNTSELMNGDIFLSKVLREAMK